MFDALLQSVWFVPCYALIGAVISIIWFPGITRRTGPRPAGYVNLLMTFFAFLHTAAALVASWHDPARHLNFEWLQVASLHLYIPIEISSLTVGAMTVITGLTLLAQIFGVGYFEMDWGWARFYLIVALFEACLCALVICDSLFFSYMILEVMTLGTYLMIGFWFNQSLVVTGARDAFLTKRIGDLFLLMGVIALYPLAGTWDYHQLATWARTAHPDPWVMGLIGLALIAGPMGKCAQFPLHLWLDEAMEAPVPSTILRNSVIVASGAWVLIKLEPVLALSPFTLNALVFIGGVTAVGASLIAIAQIDVKRTLSYPVSAYMGLVFIAVGTQQYKTAFLLLSSHALASALLVMAVGGVIWNSITQDLRLYGGLWSRRPVTGFGLIVGAVGLFAIPPFGGFWAALDLIEGIWATRPWLVVLVLLVNGLTAFGMVRVFGLMFAGKPKEMTERSPEIHWPMALPIVICLGFTLHLPLVFQSFSLLPTWQTANIPAGLLLLASSGVGMAAGAIVYLNDLWPKPVALPWKSLQDLLSYDFYTAKIYRLSVVFSVDLISRTIDWIDRYLVDGFVNLVGIVTVFSGQSLRYSTFGQSQLYMLTIVLGAIICGGIILINLN